MAMTQRLELLDCGHVGRFAGVCQHDGHGIRLCRDCLITCDYCGRTLCQQHQRWTEWSAATRVFCPDHVLLFYLRRFLKALVYGGGGRGGRV